MVKVSSPGSISRSESCPRGGGGTACVCLLCVGTCASLLQLYCILISTLIHRYSINRNLSSMESLETAHWEVVVWIFAQRATLLHPLVNSECASLQNEHILPGSHPGAATARVLGAKHLTSCGLGYLLCCDVQSQPSFSCLQNAVIFHLRSL